MVEHRGALSFQGGVRLRCILEREAMFIPLQAHSSQLSVRYPIVG